MRGSEFATTRFRKFRIEAFADIFGLTSQDFGCGNMKMSAFPLPVDSLRSGCFCSFKGLLETSPSKARLRKDRPPR